MYLRLGWVVGNAGLWGSILVVLLAHVISISTGLSISSIATDKKVGAGGVYYVLSRSLGLPIGGAIGLTLFIGTALSIALYIVGFSESFNSIIGLESHINNIRLTGSIALLILTIIAFISTSLAIKTQYFILGAIFLSLAAIFLGRPLSPEEVPVNVSPTESAPFETVFAIFFPAVTGFTAGIAMSGDLKDPKKAIPVGTIAAISVGFLVYIGLVIFLALRVDPETLKNDYNILEKIALFAPLVIAGIWGATLSSALGGILGGPRILQAMSLDKITPVIFGKEQGKAREPRIALIVAIFLAEMGILIGDLDIVARVVSMFYLAAYGFINISFFLESWASSDFRPSFRVNKWIGFIGFIATFGIMFQLDMLAMILALLVIGGIYVWLTRREIALGTGDIWRSVWSTGVKEGLKRLESKEDHKRNWTPNILLFSGNSAARPHLIELSQAIAGRSGLVTNFDLIENEGMDILFTKHKQNVKDELLKKYGIFGRQLEVQNVFKGIETIAATFGFSGVDPNSVLMGWGRNTKDPIWFAQMTRTLMNLDYNVMYVDYDEKRGFGDKEQIDLWWRGISNNAELMLQIAKFISFNTAWRNARIRILLVNDFNVDRRIIENRISKLLDEFRLKAEIKVIDNHLEHKAFYDILKAHSIRSDLVMIGIPNVVEGAEDKFVKSTNELTEIIGTTLLVKASTTFDVTQLGLKQMTDKTKDVNDDSLQLEALQNGISDHVNQALGSLDNELKDLADKFGDNCLKLITQHYQEFIEQNKKLAIDLLNKDQDQFLVTKKDFGQNFCLTSSVFREEDLLLLKEILEQGIRKYLEGRQNIFSKAQVRIEVSEAVNNKTILLRWRRAANFLDEKEFRSFFVKGLKEFGIVTSSVVIRTKEVLKDSMTLLNSDEDARHIEKKLNDKFNDIIQFSNQIIQNTIFDLRTCDRNILNQLAESSHQSDFNQKNRNSILGSSNGTPKNRIQFINNFANYWHRNQSLFHYRFETGIELRRTNLILSEGSTFLIDSINARGIDRVKSDINFYRDILTKLKKHPDKLTDGEGTELINNQLQTFDATPIFRTFRKQIGKASSFLPAEVEMMHSKSQINIDDVQGKDVHTVSFVVDRIAEYLMETNYISKVQEHLEHLSKDINEITGELFTIGDQIDVQLKEKQGSKLLIGSFVNAKLKQLDSLNTTLEDSMLAFKADIEESLGSINSLLDVQHIIEKGESLTQYVRRKEMQSGISGKLRQYRSTFNQRAKTASSFLKNRKAKQEFESSKELNETLKNSSELLRDFLGKVCSPEVEKEKIPYYYRQLFLGKHLQRGKSLDNRLLELELFEQYIPLFEQGLKTAVMISGPVLSGKSFLTEHIMHHHLLGKAYFINFQAAGNFNSKNLTMAFRQATSIEGSPEEILEKLDKSIFVFGDLEQWWLNCYNGDKLINEIVDLVKNDSKGHQFLFNCNSNVLPLIQQYSRLQEIISANILLRPLSSDIIKNEILRRHKIGGINLIYKGDLIDSNRLDRHVEKLFNRIHRLSKGNIGFAFLIWLNAIRPGENGKFIINLPEPLDFPLLIDSAYKNVLHQLFLHFSLNKDKFEMVYSSKEQHWIDNMEKDLKSSLLLEQTGLLDLQLKKMLRAHYEKYLIEKQGE